MSPPVALTGPVAPEEIRRIHKRTFLDLAVESDCSATKSKCRRAIADGSFATGAAGL